MLRSKRGENSGRVAKERLKNVLREDRTQMSAATIAAMRADIVEVLSAYAQVKDADVNLYLLRGSAGDETRLMMEAKVGVRSRTAG